MVCSICSKKLIGSRTLYFCIQFIIIPSHTYVPSVSSLLGITSSSLYGSVVGLMNSNKIFPDSRYLIAVSVVFSESTNLLSSMLGFDKSFSA